MVNIRQSDIAKELNVSRVTVSKALRNHPDISAEMKNKVNEAVKKMGYVPNLIARQLNSRKTFTIGIVVPDLENSFFSYVVDSMIDYATEKDYHVILTVSREKESVEKRNIENLIGMRVDGLLVCNSQETKDTLIYSQIKRMKIPLVFFDRVVADSGFSSVIFNDRAGALSSLDKIIVAGFTRIAHFAGFSGINIGKERSEGYRTSLEKHGIPVRKDWIIEGGYELKDGQSSFIKLLALGDMPEVIFTVNDRVALGAYKAAKEAGIRIPEDIGIFGYGFNEITDFFDPQLTVINQDPRKMGLEAVKLLINEIEKKTKSDKSIIYIEEEFLWRKSVRRKARK
jgi:LacI family transcriptional regulator